MRALIASFAGSIALALPLVALAGCSKEGGDIHAAAHDAVKQAAEAVHGAGPSSAPATGAAAGKEEEHEHEHEHGAATAAKGPGSTPADREAVDPDGIVRRGDALSKDAAIVPVSVAVQQAAGLAGKTVKIQGKVESVCQRKGCWFVVVGDKPEDRVRITAKGYGFFVPKAAAGKTAVIEGQLEVKDVDVKTAQHLEDERVLGSNEQAKKIDAPQKEFSIEASALEMRSL